MKPTRTVVTQLLWAAWVLLAAETVAGPPTPRTHQELVVETDQAASTSEAHPFLLYDPDASGAAENGPYRMWYWCVKGAWNQGENWIEHAWSRDGVHFRNRQKVVTADPRGNTVSGYQQTGCPVVVKDGDGYRLYHFRYYFTPPIHGEWAGCIEIASKSDDGIVFAGHVEHAMDPLYAVGGWDNYITRPGTVLKEDGQYVMYYLATGDPHTPNYANFIGRATSPDGIHWPRSEGPERQRMTLAGDKADWRTDSWGGRRPSVVRRGTGEDAYWMFYGAGYGSPALGGISFARSTDGIRWTDAGPVLTADRLGRALDKKVDFLADPCYFRDPRTGKEYLYFAYTADGSRVRRIGRVQIDP